MAMRRPTVYVPLSATYADDERIMEAGEDAELLYVRMLAYAARTPLTEGWISDRVLQSRLGILPRPTGNGAGTVPGTDAGSRAGVLRDVGLIERDGEGWRITSWLKWNRSAAEMSRERDRDRRRKTSGYDGSGAGTGAGNGAGVPDPFRGADTDTDTEEEEPSFKPAGLNPVKPPMKPRMNLHNFDQFWALYPRRQGKGDAEKAWSKALKSVDSDTILNGLREHLPDIQAKERQFQPLPSTWLNQRRWEDDVAPPSHAETAGQPSPPSPWHTVPLIT